MVSKTVQECDALSLAIHGVNGRDTEPSRLHYRIAADGRAMMLEMLADELCSRIDGGAVYADSERFIEMFDDLYTSSRSATLDHIFASKDEFEAAFTAVRKQFLDAKATA